MTIFRFRFAHWESLWTLTRQRQWPLSFCAEFIEWKSRSHDSGVGSGTKLVSRSDSGGRRA